MWDEKGPDQKILAVPVSDPNWNHIEELSDVPPHFLKEIEHFFTSYKELEAKKTGVEGWENREAALQTIRESELRYTSGLQTARARAPWNGWLWRSDPLAAGLPNAPEPNRTHYLHRHALGSDPDRLERLEGLDEPGYGRFVFSMNLDLSHAAWQSKRGATGKQGSKEVISFLFTSF